MVCFAYPAPHDPSSHRRIFGGSLQFDSVVTGFVCSDEMMDLRRRVTMSLLVRDARTHLEQLLAQSEPGTVARAREMITWLLPTGLCSAERWPNGSGSSGERSTDVSPTRARATQR